MVNDRLPARPPPFRPHPDATETRRAGVASEKLKRMRHIGMIGATEPVKKVLHAGVKFSANLFQIWTKIDFCDQPDLQSHLLA